jgi:hypothetical protein
MQLSAERDQSRVYLMLMLASAVALVAVLLFGIVLPNLHAHSAAAPKSTTTAVKDPQAEAAYRAVYQRDATAVKADSAPFAGTASTAGVCSKGGTRQACAAAGAKVLADLKKLQADMKPVVVPPRYADGDKLLRQAIQAEIDGLSLRDAALTSNDPTASAATGNAKLAQASAFFKQADAAFPADARPVPSLAIPLGG